MTRIAVIGGGAAGILAAIAAARTGAEVTILEHRDRIGKKILMTGNGRCNLSNLLGYDSAYYSDNPDLYKKILKQFNSESTVRFFRELGLLMKSKNGLLYPVSEQAAAVLDVLRKELTAQKVKVMTEVTIHRVIPKEASAFAVRTSKGDFSFDAVILACGGKACAQSGSDGSGYALAESLGHHIIKPLPALVQLRCSGSFFKAIAGVRAETGLELYIDGKIAAKEYGELQLTEYGISGIAVFQFSRIAARALADAKKVTVRIDFLPAVEEDSLREFAADICRKYPEITAAEVLTGILHKKIAAILIKQSGLKTTDRVSNAENKKMAEVISRIKNFTVEVTDTNSFANAQVCSGGVDCGEIGEQCNSLKVENLYLAGELLDVDGKCGGYNLQWAWASGYVAGKNAGSKEKKENDKN